MLVAMIALASKKLLDRHVHFRRWVCIEEQRAQKHDRLLRGRHIAYLIYLHVRVSSDYEAVQGLSKLFNIRRQNNDVQNFNVRWTKLDCQQANLRQKMVLEGFVWSRDHSKQWATKLSTIEGVSQSTYWSDDENSKLESPERDKRVEQLPRVAKEQEPTLREICRMLTVES